MQPHQFVTRRARNLPLSVLNRRRRLSRWILIARLATLTLVGVWIATLATLVWLATR